MLALALSPLDLARLLFASARCAFFALDSDGEVARRVRDGKPARGDGRRRGFISIQLAASWAVILAAGLLALALDPRLVLLALFGAAFSLLLFRVAQLARAPR
jgi:hypothetical protein